MEVVLFLGTLLISLMSVKVISRMNKSSGITGVDINKADKRLLPESVGIALLISVPIMTIAYAATVGFKIEFFVWLLVIGIFSLIGFFDDVKHKFLLEKTIAWKTRATVIAMVSVFFSILYAPDFFWIIPLALFIAGLASFENTFAGLNGWEIGSGFIISVFVAFLLAGTVYYGVAAILSGAILGLLVFNVYPARVFPGDSGTLLIGSGIAGLLVLTQDISLIVLGFLFFIPHIIDFALKMLTNPQDPSQAKTEPYKIMQNGQLHLPEYAGNVRYDFAKLIMKILGPSKEWVVVTAIWGVVVLNCLFWLLIFGKL